MVDGSGDGVSATLAHGTADGLKVMRQFPFSQSLGWFYETVAEHLGLGDWTSSASSWVWLATATPTATSWTPHPHGWRLPPGPVRHNNRPDESVDDQYTDLRYYRRLKTAYTATAYTNLGIPPHHRARTYTGGRIIPDTGYRTEHADLAASAQRLLEQCLTELAREALATTGATRLCIAAAASG